MPRFLALTDDEAARRELCALADREAWDAGVGSPSDVPAAADSVVVLDLRFWPDSAAPVWLSHQLTRGEMVVMSSEPPRIVADCLERWGVYSYLRYPFDDIETVALTLRNAFDKAALKRQLTALLETYDVASRAANDGLWEWDLNHNTMVFSPRWKQMLGYGEEEVGADPSEWLDRVHPEERDQLREELVVHLDRLTDRFQSEHRILHKDGRYRWMLSRALAIRDTAGKAIRLVGSQTDIMAQKLSEERLLHEASHDGLTGLPNNALLRDRLERAATYAQRRKEYLYAVLFLDVDRFKNINDSLGHMEGDAFLLAVADRLRGCVRPVDLVARLGGDEFAVLLDDISSAQDAIDAAERMGKALALPFTLGSQEVYASASIGIAISDPNAADPYSLVRNADAAMYRAKQRGSGQYEVFDSTLHAQAVDTLGLESSLRRALARHELRLHYQPIVSLQTSEVAGFEALLRWYSPDRGIVQPQDFISMAEETGLIFAIGQYVLQESCKQLVAWHSSVPRSRAMFLSVNISPRQFSQANLVDQIAAIIAETGVDPRQLKLELTESLLIDNIQGTATMMRKLQGMNLRLCIDDFGVGYSSLSTLYQLPIHTLKVDRSFVGGLPAAGGHNEIVETIVTLAHNLGMDVIAEGIENEAQLDALRHLGCEFGQGYYFSRPMSAEQAAILMSSEGRRGR